MLSCFNNNCYLYILIILLLICNGGCVRGILEKICGWECLLPVLITLILCNCNCQDKKPHGGGGPANFGGCGCK